MNIAKRCGNDLLHSFAEEMRPPRNFIDRPFAYHEEIELTIDDLTNLGSGVGRVNGWVVFVPYALPGERVRVRIWRNKSNYSDADIVEILEPSPDRVEPVCKLFKVCGGCQYQHYAYSGQLKWKTHQIRELLRRIGGLDVTVNPCHGSPLQYGYRSKITPHFRVRPDPGVPIGFQKADSRAIVDVDYCPIATESINVALCGQREAIHSGKRSYPRGGTLLLRDTAQGVVTDMHAVVVEKVGKHVFEFVAGEFFQNNPHILPDLVNYAIEAAAGESIRYLVDTYCGVGVFGICGHERFEQVVGIEVSPAAVERAQRNAELNKVANISFILGSAEAIFDELSFPANETAVLLDPPRKGCDAIFLQQLMAYRPARIVYVSCGPDTQARDLKLMHGFGYEVESVQPFDLFPQTRHVENIVCLRQAES